MRTVFSIFLLFVVGMVPLRAGATAKILVLGDSLSAAYGITRQQGWVALLQQRLHALGLDYEVINASITGDTTRGGLSRLPATLEREAPAVLIIALGGNDGLRGFAPQQTAENLREMIRQGRATGASVLLLGIKLPANYGKAFGEKFHRIFLDLAQDEEVALVPFFLEGVAETRELMQADGIHPGASAQPRILDNVWSGLVPLLGESGRVAVPAGREAAGS
ncbi:MAG: arylesterase [Chromatiaceae bacterium]|nr:arylesterase [Gammaproteobacteria bacterium]MCP5230559.1 arylesterase [Zoogloeaceae bacterium]MCP5317476.1 arylesterase [Chromatiaceae bacterium]MCP5436147.1 arylesterase [Chromatiaceae bacterium]